MSARIVTLIGNPRPHSRTYHAADLLVRELAGREPDVRIDVVALGENLLTYPSSAVDKTVDLLAAADLAVIASPTYKASYTGLLKLFLDRVPAGYLTNVTAVPLMIAADLRHAQAGEVHLKPLLSELGASCPTASCFLLEQQFNDPAGLVEWLSTERAHLEHVL